MKTYLVGFICYNHKYGCECNIDTPQDIKDRFFNKWSIDYDDYCNYALIQAENENEALSVAYEQQGATETDTAMDIWPEVEVIGEI